MQAVKGYFANGRFTPHEDVKLPSHTEVVLVFSDIIHPPALDENEKESRIKRLAEAKTLLELSRDEDLSNFPEQGQMRINFDDWVD